MPTSAQDETFCQSCDLTPLTFSDGIHFLKRCIGLNTVSKNIKYTLYLSKHLFEWKITGNCSHFCAGNTEAETVQKANGKYKDHLVGQLTTVPPGMTSE